MSAQIVVFDFIEPRLKLLSWFLRDSGLDNLRVTTLDEARDALTSRPRVLVVNSTAANSEIASLVAQVRAIDGGGDGLRVVVLHSGKHHENEDLIDADICV